jgi:2-polyprenyl-3-methyl-5-hydroxy-6-metoxy-1,4-benzoquinol methylase
MDIKNPPELIKTKYGFYQYLPLPTEEELRQYYADRYYQQGSGSYSISYSEEEIEYFKLKARLIYRKAAMLMDMKKKRSFIDIGCGEGWVLNEFEKKGNAVLGIDFSRYGVEKFHPHLLNYFEHGNIYDLLEKKIEKGSRFDVLLLANVIEHVIDPETLLQKIKDIMFPESLLIIIAPNDFSRLHELLIEKKKISRNFWLAYPDHLSYFNKESMGNLLCAQEFELKVVVADNPIDLNLLNDNSNYIENPEKGKVTHLFRVLADNFLAANDPDKLLQIYEILGSMGVGRNLNYYCSMSK